MALKACPECGKDVSDQAATCPHCGYALIAPAAPVPLAAPQPVQPASPTRWGFGLIFGGCLAVIAIPILIIALAGVCSGLTDSITSDPVADSIRAAMEPDTTTEAVE